MMALRQVFFDWAVFVRLQQQRNDTQQIDRQQRE
jgi:hypothetical protein